MREFFISPPELIHNRNTDSQGAIYMTCNHLLCFQEHEHGIHEDQA